MFIANGRVLLPDGTLTKTALRLENGRIAAIGAPAPQAGRVLDAAGGYVLPGFIDLHTHGIGYESAGGSLQAYADRMAARGTTTFLPTLFCPPDEAAAHLRRHVAETDHLRLTPNVGGFRLESPYLSFAGGGASRDLAPITDATTDLLLRAGQGHIKIWDLSPDLPGAVETIRRLSAEGVVCSLAHTHATIEQARAAVEAGARLVTHLFDTFTQPAMTEPGVYPAGLADYCLVEDRLACELIADGTHVPPLLIEKTLRCKPADKVIFVTDSNFGAGLPSGDYELPQNWGRARIDGPNNGVRLIARGLALCGSALTPLDCFRNALRLFGKTLIEASRLGSRNPALLLGWNKGEIAVGRDADLVVLDDALEVRHTLAGGACVYHAPE